MKLIQQACDHPKAPKDVLHGLMQGCDRCWRSPNPCVNRNVSKLRCCCVPEGACTSGLPVPSTLLFSTNHAENPNTSQCLMPDAKAPAFAAWMRSCSRCPSDWREPPSRRPFYCLNPGYWPPVSQISPNYAKCMFRAYAMFRFQTLRCQPATPATTHVHVTQTVHRGFTIIGSGPWFRLQPPPSLTPSLLWTQVEMEFTPGLAGSSQFQQD